MRRFLRAYMSGVFSGLTFSVVVRKRVPVFSGSRRILDAQAEEAASVARKSTPPQVNRRAIAAGSAKQNAAPNEARPPLNNEIPPELPHQGSMAVKHPTAQPTWTSGHEPARPNGTASLLTDDDNGTGNSAGGPLIGKTLPVRQPGS